MGIEEELAKFQSEIASGPNYYVQSPTYTQVLNASVYEEGRMFEDRVLERHHRSIHLWTQ